jgi:hypothetical protein
VVRLRSAGWLIGIPPLALGLQCLDVADASPTATFPTTFLKVQFAFWDSGISSSFRPRIFLNLVLFLVAGVTCLVAVTAGRARTLVIVVAAVQAVVALTGLVWRSNFVFGRADAPDFILHTIPVFEGRATSGFFLLIALTALGLALSNPPIRPVAPVQTF